MCPARCALWQHLTSQALWPYERLFFEVYTQGLQGKQPAKHLLKEAIDAWLGPIADLLASRGLLLDLLATGDVAAVDAAMDRFGALYLRARPGFATRSTQRSGVSS